MKNREPGIKCKRADGRFRLNVNACSIGRERIQLQASDPNIVTPGIDR